LQKNHRDNKEMNQPTFSANTEKIVELPNLRMQMGFDICGEHMA